MSRSERSLPARARREPPRFRLVKVRHTERVSPRLVGVTLGGTDLEGLRIEDPAASVRLLLPSPGSQDLVIPSWNGNEFLLPGGRRPAIRTLTPRRLDVDALEIYLEIVIHEDGIASRWAEAAVPGAASAISGPGRGYAIDGDAPAFLLAGDETAIPAMSQLLEALPAGKPVQVHIEVASPDARLAMPSNPAATVEWHDLAPGAPPGDALVAAIRCAQFIHGTRTWVAAEAAAAQRIRRHLFDDRGVQRAHTSVRGYWKHGRRGDAGESLL